jgi:hypothetical protein
LRVDVAAGVVDIASQLAPLFGRKTLALLFAGIALLASL